MGIMTLPGVLAFYKRNGLNLLEIIKQKRYMKVYIYEKRETTERGMIIHG